MAAVRAPLRPMLLSRAARLLATGNSSSTNSSNSTTTTTTTTSRRFESTAAFDHVKNELPARKLPVVWDYLVPTPSHLLNVALNDLLPPETATTNGGGPHDADAFARNLPTASDPAALPHSHHLVYFPPPIPGASLLPDGTDPLQSPGGPFVRRMWAGGSVRFNLDPAAKHILALDGARAACVESIRDVAVKGAAGQEKIFVGIERRVGRPASDAEDEHTARQRLWRDDERDFGDAVGVIERRNIVFMRERSPEQAKADLAKARSKQMQPPSDRPDVRVDVTPDQRLLFRYSALTYNAHSIHLDPQFCRDVEGHRGLLVHGPLSFTLLVTVLRRHLAQQGAGEEVSDVEYRNLSPLYAGERLRLCARQVKAATSTEAGRWEAWAETPEGGVAVNAKVWTALSR